MIVFKEIIIEGYGSIVNKTKFLLDRGGSLNIIRGKVGSGKTSIVSALCWVVYGKSLKDKSQIETWDEIRPTNYKGTCVKLLLTRGENTYEIIRTQNYKSNIDFGDKQIRGGSNIYIIENGEPITEIKDKKSTNELVANIIGYSFDLFKNSIVFGQKLKRIIEESGPDKKKLFEEAFDIGFIDKIRDSEKEKLENLISLKSDLDNGISKNDSKLELLNKNLESAKEYEEFLKKERDNSIRKIKEEIYELEKVDKPKSIDGLEEDIKSKKKTIDYFNGLCNSKTKAKHDLTILQSKLKSLSKPEKPKLKCLSCGSDLKGKVKKEAINRYKKLKEKYKEDKANLKGKIGDKNHLLEELENKIKEYNLDKLTKELDKLKVTKSRRDELVKTYKKAQKKIEELNREIEEINSRKHINRIPDIKKSIDQVKKHKKELKSKYRKVEKKIELISWLVNEPLSNNGLKNYIFNALLDQVNEQLYSYSNILGFVIEFGIDLTTARKDFYQLIMQDDIIIPYTDLSGGQKQLVDTAVAFAINATINKLKPTNLLFLDEPFESLGGDEVEIIDELVNSITDKSVYVITHNTLFNPLNSNTITIKRSPKSKITKIIS